MLPTSTDVTISVRPKSSADAEAVVAFIMQGARDAGVNVISKDDHRAIARLIEAGVVRGKTKEIAFDIVDAGKGKHRRVFVVGLGPAEKVTAETIRQSAGMLAKALRKHRIQRVAIKLPAVEAVAPALAADAIVTGMMLARFRFQEFKGSAGKKKDAAAEPSRSFWMSKPVDEGRGWGNNASPCNPSPLPGLDFFVPCFSAYRC